MTMLAQSSIDQTRRKMFSQLSENKNEKNVLTALLTGYAYSGW